MTQHGPIAFVLKADHTIEQRALKLGQRQEDAVIVLEGIQAGEEVVTDGQLNLFSGAKASVKGG